MYDILSYIILGYIIANSSLMLRVFFQLYIAKKPITKADFVLSVFWPIMIWLIPISYIKDIKILLRLYKIKRSNCMAVRSHL